MHGTRRILLVAALLAMTAPAVANATPDTSPTPVLLASGLTGATGSTIGPDEALYVPAGRLGTITRVDPETGATSTYLSGLPIPNPAAPTGGAMDVAFIGNTAYVLVTLIGADSASPSPVGLYRRDSATTSTEIADIGTYSRTHPPTGQPPFAYGRLTGVQFALQPVAGGFLVTDGHLNRVLRVGLDGTINDVISFGNIVPTGLAMSHNTVYMAQAGPVPHDPSTGKVVSFNVNGGPAKDVASGFSLIVDVEVGPEGQLFALSQGDSPGNVPAASPALPNSGELLRVNKDGTFTTVVGSLNLPTSLEFIGETAFVTTLHGDVLRIEHVRGGQQGHDH
jgi:hypothetical protein